MGIRAIVKTDLRVGSVVEYFQNISGWKVLYAIDSVNCGEGYDLTYEKVLIRLFDDERSDAVQMHEDFKIGGNWDELFEKVVQEYAGESCVKFEIDRHDSCSAVEQEAAFQSISEVMKQHGHNLSLWS